MHPLRHLAPSVIITVQENGFEEEDTCVQHKCPVEDGDQVLHQPRIQNEQEKGQERAETCRKGERDGQKAREFIRQIVVALVAVAKADELNRESEHRNGEHERAKHEVQLGNHPNHHAAAYDGKGAVLDLSRGFLSPRIGRPKRNKGHARKHQKQENPGG